MDRCKGFAMTQGWLPEGFENQDVTAPSRVAGGVRQRVQAHRRRVRTLCGGAAITALALILGAAPALWRSVRQAPQPAPQPIASMNAQKPGWSPEHTAGAVLPVRPESDPGRAPLARMTPGSSHSGSTGIQGSSPEVTLSKAKNGVELEWTGSPQKEYVVYRCTTPKFDQCSVAGTVKGTQWNDTGSDTAPVVFYKVEPKA